MDLTRCSCFGVAVLICIISVIPISKSQGVPAIAADLFVDSIGVNTHWGYSNAYMQNYTALKTKLGEAGIRYVRDGAYSEAYIRAVDLYQSLGIKTCMLTGRRSGPYPAPLDPSKIDGLVRTVGVIMDMVVLHGLLTGLPRSNRLPTNLFKLLKLVTATNL